MKLNLRIHFISTILCLLLFILSLYGITLIWRLQSVFVLASVITYFLAWKYAKKDNIRWLRIYLRSLLFTPVILSIISCILGGGILFIYFFFYMILFILGGENKALYSKDNIKITRSFTFMTYDAYDLRKNYYLFDKTEGQFNYVDYDEFHPVKVTPLPNKDTINMLLIEKPEGKVDTITITH